MNNITESVLVESRSARSLHLSNLSNDRAIELLDKAKALVAAFRQGTGIATTEQMAEYYEVPNDTVQKVYQRNREELQSDGVKTLKGKQLIGMDKMSKPQDATVLTIWTPRGALRLGMLLRDSPVARNIRSVILDIVAEDKKTDPVIELNWSGLIETLEAKITQIVRRELSTQYQRQAANTDSLSRNGRSVDLNLSITKEEELTQALVELFEIRDRWCDELGIISITNGDRAFCEAARNGKVPEIDRLLPALKWGTTNGISRGSLMRHRRKLASNGEIRNLARPKTKIIASHPKLEAWVRAQRAAFPQETVVGLHRRMQLQHADISVSITTLNRWLEAEGIG